MVVVPFSGWMESGWARRPTGAARVLPVRRRAPSGGLAWSPPACRLRGRRGNDSPVLAKLVAKPGFVVVDELAVDGFVVFGEVGDRRWWQAGQAPHAGVQPDRAGA